MASKEFSRNIKTAIRRIGAPEVAGDSAKPLPHSMWERIDPEVLREAVDRLNANEGEPTVIMLPPEPEVNADTPQKPRRLGLRLTPWRSN